LAKFPLAVQFEEKTKVPKVYIALGASTILLVLIFFNVWGDLLTVLFHSHLRICLASFILPMLHLRLWKAIARMMMFNGIAFSFI
jgi:hypothetical protein